MMNFQLTIALIASFSMTSHYQEMKSPALNTANYFRFADCDRFRDSVISVSFSLPALRFSSSLKAEEY